MTPNWKKCYLGLLSTAVLVSAACNKNTDNPSNRGEKVQPANGKVIVDVDLINMSADDLTNAAEKIFTGSTFPIAVEALDRALAKDPGHPKANLLAGAWKPFSVFKGAMVRARPFVRYHGDIKEHEESIRKIPDSPSRDFILDGKEDITTIADIQNLLVQHRDGWLKYYNWLKKNEDKDITINAQAATDSRSKDCKVLSKNLGQYRLECDHVATEAVRFTTPDLIALRQYVAGLATYFAIYTAYTVDGIDAFVKTTKDQPFDGKMLKKMLDSHPRVGLLRADNAMSFIKEFGSDFASAWQYAINNQPTLCPRGRDHAAEVQRPGAALAYGQCIRSDSEDKKDLSLLITALNGPIEQTWSDDGVQKKALINFFALATRPAANFRTYMPVGFNKCGQATGYADPTLGGIFPQGDANQLISKCAE